MRITLFDTNADLCTAWEKEFKNCSDISIMNCELVNLPYHDFLVTAGNSFGAMSGGIDLAVRNMFGYGFQDAVQLEIMRSVPYGIPLGNILTLNLALSDKFNHVIYAPTMRAPSQARPLDIMYVMSVIVNVVLDFPNKTFTIPGLGTGCKQLSPNTAAKAMKASYDAGVFIRMENEGTAANGK